MEETVWVIVGIVSVLLAVGIMVQFVLIKTEDDKVIAVQTSIDSLYTMCNSVCAMPEETYLRTTVSLPAGVLIETKGRSICGTINEELICRTCQCNVTEKTVLNLTSPEASRFFFTHEYHCFFLRTQEGLNITCIG